MVGSPAGRGALSATRTREAVRGEGDEYEEGGVTEPSRRRLLTRLRPAAGAERLRGVGGGSLRARGMH